MPKRHLSRAEVIKVNEILKNVLIINENGVEYKEGYSDIVVAREISPDIQASAIGGVRLELFGKLRSSTPAKDDAQIKELVGQVTNLTNTVHELQLKHKRLCENLTINKVLNVKHLE